MVEIIVHNLFTPVVLFFVLGLFASIVKSDLKFPDGLSEALSIYLLIAIGLKGGIELSEHSMETLLKPMMGTLFLGLSIPLLTLGLCRAIGLDLKNSVGLAASYGSVSIVTYGAALSFLDYVQTDYETFMGAMVVLMESPAILVSLYILRLIEQKKDVNVPSAYSIGIVAGGMTRRWLDPHVVRESLFGKSILLLLGSLLIGWAVGEEAIPKVKPLFMDLYGSILILFLLNMGLIAGKRIGEVFQHGIKLVLVGIFLPLFLGVLGAVVGYVVGLSHGGMTLMAILAASASYIAAPAALRSSVPEANPSIYLGLALGITFPFNLIIGLPLYYEVARFLTQV